MLIEFVFKNLTPFLIAFGLAALATLFWLYFWYHYSKKYTTPRKFLLLSFILGIFGAVVVAFFEKGILIDFLPQEFLSVLEQKKSLFDSRNIILIFGVAFFLTALPEEILKFLFFKIALFSSKYFNQIIDGIKFGIVLGLGFALIENSYFFFKQITTSPLGGGNLPLLFLFRFFIATLAHSLYGGILGYYFGLARFYKVFEKIFLWQGLLSVIIFHTFFNFLILTPLNVFTLLILIALLVIIMKWYTDRRNFQFAIYQKIPRGAKPPILAGRHEVQALIAEGTGSNFRIVSKLGLCPFCFKKAKKGETNCHYCGRKLK